MSEKKNTFFGGAAILAVGAVVVKLIGALFKIPMANILGSTGNGYFQSAYNIYGVLLTISTGGLPVALSKQVSEAHSLGLVNQKKRIFTVAMRTLFIFGLVCFAVMFFGARTITATNPGAYCATVALAPACLFVCCMSALRGYTQGQGIMAPTAVSQILEALCKLILGLTLAYVFLHWGANMTDTFTPLELAAAGAIAGVTIGTLVSLVYLSLDRVKRNARHPEKGTDTPQSDRAILSRLVKLAVPITLGSSVVPIVNYLDTIQIQSRLQAVFQMSANAASDLYGTYGAAVNLYNLPSALMVPFTASLIPAISAARARHDLRGATRVTESAMRVAMLLACPMGVGLSALASPIVTMLYPKYDAAIMGPILAVLGITSIFTCIVVLSNSILQANGFVNLPIVTMVIGGVLKLVVNYTLVGNPSIGIQGAPVGTLACFGVVGILDLFIIHRVLPASPNYMRIFLKPVLCSAVMGLAAWASFGLLSKVLFAMKTFQSVVTVDEVETLVLSHMGGAIATLAAIAIAVVVYAVLVLVLHAISKEDLALMPKGDKIAKFLRIR